MRIDHYHHPMHDEADGRVTRKLDQILTLVRALVAQETHEMTLIQELKDQAAALQASVEAETEIDVAIEKVLTMQNDQIIDLTAKLKAAVEANDPVAIQALIAALGELTALNTAQAAARAQLVIANTTAA